MHSPKVKNSSIKTSIKENSVSVGYWYYHFEESHLKEIQKYVEETALHGVLYAFRRSGSL